MKIAPIDIAHKSFERKLMGLDPVEVTDFLRSVSEVMEDLIRERNSLKEAMREKELQILDFKERDDTLKNTITTASRMSDRICADADREAKLILNDANQKAEAIVRDARDSLKRMYQDIADLRKTRLLFEQNLRALVQAHLSMVDQSQSWMPDPQVSPAVLQTLQTIPAHPVQAAQVAPAAQVMAQPLQPQTAPRIPQAAHPSAATQGMARAGFRGSEPSRS